MSLTDTPITLEDLAANRDGKLYELVRGELVEKHMAAESIWIVTQIAALLSAHLRGKNVGWVFCEQPLACFAWLGNRHIRRPDVLYISRGKHPSARSRVAALLAAPELCVEVLSPNDDVYELEAKIAEYLQAGVQLVWVVNPAQETVRIHRADGTITQLSSKDTLTGEAVVPGFAVPVADFFPPL